MSKRPLFVRVRLYLQWLEQQGRTTEYIPIHPDDIDEAWTACVESGLPYKILGS